MSALDELRTRKLERKSSHPVNIVHHEETTLGERVADRMSAGIGSWWFLIVQSGVIVIWITFNVIGLIQHWDPYPFFLLNFGFTLQAAFTGPVLLLAGKRQNEKDRLMLEHAAAESESSEHQTLDLSKEIEQNTETTLKILEHIRKGRKQAGGPPGQA
jgi:uncharacterized membrane protein